MDQRVVVVGGQVVVRDGVLVAADEAVLASELRAALVARDALGEVPRPT